MGGKRFYFVAGRLPRPPKFSRSPIKTIKCIDPWPRGTLGAAGPRTMSPPTPLNANWLDGVNDGEKRPLKMPAGRVGDVLPTSTALSDSSTVGGRAADCVEDADRCGDATRAPAPPPDSLLVFVME